MTDFESVRPHEEAVVGSLVLLPQDEAAKAAALVNHDDFLGPGRELVKVLRQMIEDKAPHGDLIAVAGQTQAITRLPGPDPDWSWAAFLSNCCNAVISPGNILWHYERVRESAIRRRFLNDLAEMAQGAKDGRDVDVLAAALADKAEKLIQETARIEAVGMERLADETYAAILAGLECPVPGIRTGLARLDEVTGGLQPNDLILLAARPSIGKSALALQIAKAALDQDKGVLFFSLEMGRESLIHRLLAMAERLELWKLRKHRIAENELSDIAKRLSDWRQSWNFWVYDNVLVNAEEMLAQAQRVQARGPLDLIILDYLQLMDGRRGRGESREQEVANISRRLKHLARRFGVPVLALSQLNRAAEVSNERPQLSNLRESGALEQDADVVLFLHRTQAAAAENQFTATIDLDVAKQRNGEAGVRIPLAFRPAIQLFAPLAQAVPQPAPGPGPGTGRRPYRDD